MDLIPGTNHNINKKSYKWKIHEYSEWKMSVDLYFDNPEQVSTDEENPDVLKVTFKNTELYLKPADNYLDTVEDGY